MRASSFWGADDLGDVPREGSEIFPINARRLLEISAVDTQIITTLYKKVISILTRGRAFCDFGLLIVG